MKLRKNDIVKVLTGKDKNKTGKVLELSREHGYVIVEGLNKVKKHVKKGVGGSKEGGILSFEAPITISNVMYYDEKAKKATKLGFKTVKGKKYRYSKARKDIVDNA